MVAFQDIEHTIKHLRQLLLGSGATCIKLSWNDPFPQTGILSLNYINCSYNAFNTLYLRGCFHRSCTEVAVLQARLTYYKSISHNEPVIRGGPKSASVFLQGPVLSLMPPFKIKGNSCWLARETLKEVLKEASTCWLEFAADLKLHLLSLPSFTAGSRTQHTHGCVHAEQVLFCKAGILKCRNAKTLHLRAITADLKRPAATAHRVS